MASADDRDPQMIYRRCGTSGLMLPAISLGCWHNFGDASDTDMMGRMLCGAFDLGITHFDLANNYGPPPGSAETHVGRILAEQLASHRDKLIISTKAGYLMWDGPYGEWGSRKHIIASCDQSLKRLGLDYVDIFYHHRPDTDTPIEESIGALDHLVRQGKALYVGISNYRGAQTVEAVKIARDRRTPLVIHQPHYNLMDRWIEDELLPVTGKFGLGVMAFCPLQQGLLTDRYLDGIPADSRASMPGNFLSANAVTDALVSKVRQLNAIAKRRSQTMAQMALAWTLRDPRVTSALIGASRVEQIEQNVAALSNIEFSDDELTAIDEVIDPPGSRT